MNFASIPSGEAVFVDAIVVRRHALKSAHAKISWITLP